MLFCLLRLGQEQIDRLRTAEELFRYGSAARKSRIDPQVSPRPSPPRRQDLSDDEVKSREGARSYSGSKAKSAAILGSSPFPVDTERRPPQPGPRTSSRPPSSIDIAQSWPEPPPRDEPIEVLRPRRRVLPPRRPVPIMALPPVPSDSESVCTPRAQLRPLHLVERQRKLSLPSSESHLM